MLSQHLAQNIRTLRASRGLTQAALAGRAGIPRPTWTALESGAANPTLAVLVAAAEALGVRVDELLAAQVAEVSLHRVESLPQRHPGQAHIRRMLPQPLPGVEFERFELPEGGRFTGVPHVTGTREYLTCERGVISLTVAAQGFVLNPGDVAVFRGDQRHGYVNVGVGICVGYSVVVAAG